MERRIFVKNVMTLMAFASTYHYVKAGDLLLQKPDKDFDLFFSKIRLLSLDYLNGKINDTAWRCKINELYILHFNNSNAKDLQKYIDFKKLKKKIDFTNKGRGRALVETPLSFKEEKLTLKTQLIGVQKGYAIPPHIHENMSSCSLILSGEMLVSHYNRLETHKEYVIVEKDSEHYQKQGDWSIVSPIKNNLHWFKSFNKDSYMLNVNIEGLNSQKAKPGIRVDINPTKDAGQNKFKAIIISDQEAQLKYGKL